MRHAANGAVSHILPSPFADGLGHAILGNFGVDAAVAVRSATPINVLTGTDPLGLGLTTVARPDIVAGQPFSGPRSLQFALKLQF